MELRAVLVGCGLMSRRWLEAAAGIEGLTIAGLVDLDVSRARSRADEFGMTGSVVGSDLGAVLSATKPQLVFDIVVPDARFDVVQTAFGHGCHVLSEKPMANSLAHAQALVRAARETGCIHSVVQNRRYVEGVRRMQAFAASGAIGAVTSLHSDFFLAPHFGGFRETMENVLLLDMAIHTFDAARYIVGTSPQAVYCHETNPRGSWYAHGASAYAIFEFAGDVTYTYRGSWCAQGQRTSWESAWRIIGERGTLSWDGHGAFLAQRETGTSGLLRDAEEIPVPELDPNTRIGGHEGVMRDFIEAVRTGSAPETVGSENIKSLAMVVAAIESAKTRERVLVRSQEIS
ncbi:MAG TPA: Gfo/Idh/MocA family oxidoreductase [Bryobacteraceae bacterium]|nr:Gfo/Idh/MocA family oxidoreductase [Bryobacteraceae bacterium]